MRLSPRRPSPPSIVLLLMIACVCVLVACATNPATGRKQIILVSKADEVRMGLESVPGILQEFGAYEDAAVSSYVDTLGRELATKVERRDLPFRFTVLDSPVVNAFALPGGPVFVTRGLLAHANDQAELAGVVGHEIGHVEARHSAEQLSRGQLLGLGIGVAAIARPELQRFGQLIGASAQLLMLRYSRDAEREADMLGVRYMARAGYDPMGMPRFMRVLDRLSADSGRALPGWLATHPDPGERVQTTTRLAKESPVQNPRTLRENHLRAVDGIVFGDDPRQGFQRGATFHHPGLKFRFDLPAGWKSINTQSAVAAVDNDRQPTAQVVMKIVPKDAGGDLPPDAYAQRLASKNPTAKFAGSAAPVNGKPAWVGRVAVTDETGATQTLSAAWISHGGALYQFLGAVADAGGSGPGQIEKTLRSFRDESDAAVLNVKPVVVKLLRNDRATTYSAFCAARSNLGAPCGEVARINHGTEADALEAGATVKVPTRQSAVYP